MYTALTHPAIYPGVLEPYANVTYAGRIPDGTTDCSSWLNDVKASGARLLIHIFSGATGVPFIMQWKALNVSALPVGINVMGQLQSHWSTTAGACEYESILAFSGTRTPIIPGLTEVFWDNFVALTGTWPLYTAWGAYDGIYGLKEAIEDIDTTDKDALVAYYENPAYMRQGLNGIFKYTNSSASRHDVVVYDLGPTWDYGFVRAFISQWTAARLEVVIPLDQVYSKKWAIPPNMYPLIEDINYDGKVDIKDVALAAKAFGTVPGDPRWEKEADINFDNKVDIKDIATIAKQFGTVISLPLP